MAADMDAEWELTEASGTRPPVVRCDAAEATHVHRLQALFQELPLTGTWHAAGLLADSVLPRQAARLLGRVYGPKAHGAWSLHDTSAMVPLRASALFSSVAALLGGAGQANYAAANACLDGLAGCRRVHAFAAA